MSNKEKFPVKNILILTSYRCGSSFLGELINQYPGIFYFYEPLHYYSYINKEKVQEETDFLTSLFNCDFSDRNHGYLEHLQESSHSFLMTRHNKRLWSSCSVFKKSKDNSKEKLCFSENYLNMICPLYPIRMIKTVRLRLNRTLEMLQSDPNLQILVLVRDPRAVFSSRWAESVSTWCRNDHCRDPETSCNDIMEDVISAKIIMEQFPGRVLLIRYEDLSLYTRSTAKKIFEFFNLPWVKSIENYISIHTKGVTRSKKERLESKDPYGTIRNSTASVMSWTKSLSHDNITLVQEKCSGLMSHLGYTRVNISETWSPTLADLMELGKQWHF